MKDIFIKKRREIVLDVYKSLFKHHGKSMLFSVTDSGIMTISITDIAENKGFCGIHSGDVFNVFNFLDRQLEKIKNIS